MTRSPTLPLLLLLALLGLTSLGLSRADPQATPAARETAAWAFRHHPTLVSREAISSEKRPERA